MHKERGLTMRVLPAALLLALTSIVPALAATCPQEARLRADPRWTPRDEENCDHCLFNIVLVGRNGLLIWNGGRITEAMLSDYLGNAARLNPPPVALLGIMNDADCALIARVVAVIERHGECYGDHCGFGLYRKPVER
jgi:hypothetical protein